MKSVLKNFLPFIILIALVSLACQINAGGPTAPRTVAFSQDAADSVEQLWASIDAANLTDSTATISLTEEQLTSYLAVNMAAKKEGDAAIINPTILLENGQMEIYGQINTSFLTANAHLSLTMTLDDEGQPQLDVVSADLGPLPMPDGLMDAIASVMDEALTGSFGSVATGVRLSDIQITDGVLTFNIQKR